ncbi:MAG: carbamoyl-phosphate synthase large subunit [Spirochaetia bacterium]|nr:carbamoyl-phosphate synthase large subunit [Spirochaetia bacterium]
MPKRTDIKKILIIGSGPIVIGQACEFDYSGTQAVKALKDEGYQTVLINSNPATIMTDPELADRVYIEPIDISHMEEIIKNERPDAILPTVGGQTALNAALKLESSGILKKYNIELIGAKADAIRKAEDRELFKQAMQNIGASVPESGVVTNLQEALALAQRIGFPLILRPSFTLGGTGGGVCYNLEEFETMIARGLYESPVNQILVEQSVLGWKEFELEVMRDRADNVVIVCSIENLDPMGIHTGDSITVAPQQTLSDKEYQKLRDLSMAIIREIGVETGGSNIQFAVNPVNGDVIVIEMNPRVSRSSALASKATGFPIAKIAAKLSVGYTLDEIMNDVTRKTPASFEPSIDYIVTKIPRFTFEKFPETPRILDTQMRSVGEAMAIGRTFQESFQKCLRSLETGRSGWGCDGKFDISAEISRKIQNGEFKSFIKEALSRPGDLRIFYIREALLHGISMTEIYEYSNIDPWFLTQLIKMIRYETSFKEEWDKTNTFSKEIIIEGLRLGYSERQFAFMMAYSRLKEEISALIKYEKGSPEFLDLEWKIESEIIDHQKKVEQFLMDKKMAPVYKRVDTCAAEFESYTPYMYSTTETECESNPTEKEKVLILGGGPNRIGQGIEFDYCCCHASFAIQEMGLESIMINSNPETVSTDYDTSDRLYFEPLTLESVINIYKKESQKGKIRGVILQFGGQTPLRLANGLNKKGIPILGTSWSSIDLAENRQRFSEIIEKLNLKQPRGAMATSLVSALAAAEKIGYPVLARPSYVLGGRAMLIVHNADQLTAYMKQSAEVSKDRPVLIDQFLENAVELDVDAICDGRDVFIAGILEHIEEAGIHSGDSACILPPFNISGELLDQIKIETKKLALELNVIGLMNIQFAIYDEELYILEVNPRASRTVPFVSKATGIPLAKAATRVMLGKTLRELNLIDYHEPSLYYAKEVVFPFKKFAGVDTILGPEMKSTGEVMGIGKTPAEAFFKSQIAVNAALPLEGKIFVSVNDACKPAIAASMRKAADIGFTIVATENTSRFLNQNGIETEKVLKVHEGRPHIVDKIRSREIQLVINIPVGIQTRNDALEIRLSALRYNIPYMTTVAAVIAAIDGIAEMKYSPLSVYCLSDKH